MTTELPSTSRIQRGKSFRFRDWIRNLISPGDSSHQLAFGASVGVFVAFTPLLGLHLVIIVCLAFLLQRIVRFNKALAITTSYLSNPLTFAPILWASYEVGAGLVPAGAGKFNPQELPRAFDWRGGIQSIPEYLMGIGLPMLLGSVILGGCLALVTYPVALALVTWYRCGGTPRNFAILVEPIQPVGTSETQVMERVRSEVEKA